MSRTERVEKTLQDLESVKNQVNNILYYSEGEDLQIREKKKDGWTSLEIIYHINQLNAHYLAEIEAVVPRLKKSKREELKTSWLGRKMTQALGPLGEKNSGIKFKSPAKVHPLKLQKQGFAISEDVIFRELLKDLDTIERHLKQLKEKNYDEHKIKTLISWLKINAGEALILLVRHTQRHVGQIQRLLK